MEMTIIEALGISALGLGVVFGVLVFMMGLLYLMPLVSKLINRENSTKTDKGGKANG